MLEQLLQQVSPDFLPYSVHVQVVCDSEAYVLGKNVTFYRELSLISICFETVL